MDASATVSPPVEPTDPGPACPTVTELLRLTVQQGATDLHVASGRLARFRVNGRLVAREGYHRGSEEVSLRMPDGEALTVLLGQDLTEHERDEWRKHGRLDKAIMLADGTRFRCNYYWTGSEERQEAKAAFRYIPATPPSLDDLGHPDILKRVTSYPGGLVLVTGPTGSGKSTTIAAMLRHINEGRAEHIITIEDPIEYLHRDQQSLIDQRQVGRDTDDFTQGLVEALRQDPDIVLVGEMRDPETVKTALDAAQTGHLVFSTLHTQDAAQSVDRILGQVPSDEKAYIRLLLATTLRAVITQTLLPRQDGKGRIAAQEVLINSSAVSAQIREEKIHQIHGTVQSSRALGMQTMEYALTRLLVSGAIDERTAVRAARHIGELEALVERASPGQSAGVRLAVDEVGQDSILEGASDGD